MPTEAVPVAIRTQPLTTRSTMEQLHVFASTIITSMSRLDRASSAPPGPTPNAAQTWTCPVACAKTIGWALAVFARRVVPVDTLCGPTTRTQVTACAVPTGMVRRVRWVAALRARKTPDLSWATTPIFPAVNADAAIGGWAATPTIVRNVVRTPMQRRALTQTSPTVCARRSGTAGMGCATRARLIRALLSAATSRPRTASAEQIGT
mmetsp:Transcript_30352/g.46669  ORF Transcript_30352/g.46669 Transcript_30352/m.46669 type:complete len:207 (+) Transcript_30352:138-758(+)